MSGVRRVSALLAGLTLASGGALAALPDFDALRAGQLSSETRVLDRHGELLQRLRSNPQRRQGEWVNAVWRVGAGRGSWCEA